MTLKAKVDSLDEVHEAFRSEYVERGGSFVLQVEGVDALPSVTGLKSAYEKVTRERDQLKEAVGAFGSRTPEQLEELEKELATLRESKGGDLISAEDLQDLKNRLKTTSEQAKRAKELEAELQTFKDDQSNRLRKEIAGALAKAGARSEAVDVVAASFLSDFNARYEPGEKGFDAVVTGEMQGVPGDHKLDEFAASWLKSDGSWAMSPSGRGGSGIDAESGSGDSGSKGSINRSDPMAWGQHAEAIAKGEMSVAD